MDIKIVAGLLTLYSTILVMNPSQAVTLEEAQNAAQIEQVYAAEQYVVLHVPDGAEISSYEIITIADKHYVSVSWFQPDGTTGEFILDELGELTTQQILYESQLTDKPEGRISPDCYPMDTLCISDKVMARTIELAGSSELIETHLFLARPAANTYAKEKRDNANTSVDEDGNVTINGQQSNLRPLEVLTRNNARKRQSNTDKMSKRALEGLKDFDFIKSGENKYSLKNALKDRRLSLRLNLTSDQITELEQSTVKGILQLWVDPVGDTENKQTTTTGAMELDTTTRALSGNRGAGVKLLFVEKACPTREHPRNYVNLRQGGSRSRHGSIMMSHANAIVPNASYSCWASDRLFLTGTVYHDIDAHKPDIANYSIGTTGVLMAQAYESVSSQLDFKSYEHLFLPVVSAGNDSVNSIIDAPGASYNALTVGAYNAANKEIYNQDTRGSHGVKNPYTNSLKPEISSPGHLLVATGYGETGETSDAAAYVSGAVTAILSDMPWIKQKPWLLKSMVLAGASVKTRSQRGGGNAWNARGLGGFQYEDARYAGNWSLDGIADLFKASGRRDGNGKYFLQKERFVSRGNSLRVAVTCWTDSTWETLMRNSYYKLGDVYQLQVFDPNYNLIHTSKSSDYPPSPILTLGTTDRPYFAQRSGLYKFRITELTDRNPVDVSIGLAVRSKNY